MRPSSGLSLESHGTRKEGSDEPVGRIERSVLKIPEIGQFGDVAIYKRGTVNVDFGKRPRKVYRSGESCFGGRKSDVASRLVTAIEPSSRRAEEQNCRRRQR